MAVHCEIRELIIGPSGDWAPFGRPRRQSLPVGTLIEFGRADAGGIEIARRLLDRKVSGTAVELTTDGRYWDITVTNRRGVLLQPWGLAPMPMSRGDRTRVGWRRVGLYVRGDEDAYQHWILLEGDGVLALGDDQPGTGTVSVEENETLEPSEELIVRTKFADTLAWPPRYPARILTNEECADRTPWDPREIRHGLLKAQKKAGFLPEERRNLSDPGWVYRLVERGQLRP